MSLIQALLLKKNIHPDFSTLNFSNIPITQTKSCFPIILPPIFLEPIFVSRNLDSTIVSSDCKLPAAELVWYFDVTVCSETEPIIIPFPLTIPRKKTFGTKLSRGQPPYFLNLSYINQLWYRIARKEIMVINPTLLIEPNPTFD